MTYAEIKNIIAAIAAALKCEFAYSCFKTGKRSRFLIFYYENSDDVYADGENYKGIENLVIEFYSPTKEIDNENTIQTMLKASGLSYSKTSAYINSEALHITTYNLEVMING